nr:hypothetical protein [bacterium]
MKATKLTFFFATICFFASPVSGFWDHGEKVPVQFSGPSDRIVDYAGTSLMKALHHKYDYPTVGGLDFFTAVILEDEYNEKSIELHYCKVDQYPIRKSLVNTGKDWFKVFAIDLPPDTVDVYAPSIDCFSVEQDMNRVYTIVVMSFVYEDSSGTFCRIKSFKFQPDGTGSLDMVTPATLEDQVISLSGSCRVTKSITSYFHYKDAGQKTVFVGLESWDETPVHDICNIEVYSIDINQTTINNLDDTYTIEYEYDSDFALIYEASFTDLGGFMNPRNAFLDFACIASTSDDSPVEHMVVSHNYQFSDFYCYALTKVTRSKTESEWSEWLISGNQILRSPLNFTGEVHIEKNNQLIKEGSISVFVSSIEPGSGEKKILTAVVTLPSWNVNSVLKEITTIPESSQWDIKADRGLIGLQSTSYNKGSLAYCDWANHRADWISEPPQIMESTPIPMSTPLPGYWVAEMSVGIQVNYPEDGISTGELSRVYQENTVDPPDHFSIRRQFHF